MPFVSDVVTTRTKLLALTLGTLVLAMPALAEANPQCRWRSGSIELVVDPSLDAVQGHGSAAVHTVEVAPLDPTTGE